MFFIVSADGAHCKGIAARKEKIIYFTSINSLDATHTGVLQQFLSQVENNLWSKQFLNLLHRKHDEMLSSSAVRNRRLNIFPVHP